MNEENNNSSEKRRMDWHSGFEGGLRYSFRNYTSDIEIERERLLSKQPLRIDFLVVKNNTQIVIDNDIGRSFRKYNIIEYKNPDDALDIDVLWKCIGYSGIFKSLGNYVNEIRADEITITICRIRRPNKLFRQLDDEGCVVTRLYPGIYQISGIIVVPILIVVLSELKDNELNSLKIMTANADEGDIRNFITEASKLKEQGDKNNADAVLQISASVNKTIFEKIRGEEDMCEALRELMADDLKNAEKQGIERGLEQGLEQGVNNTNELYAWLFEQNRAADVQRATKDHAYLNKLMEEYKKRAQRYNC
ncbi:hypothetical protein SAMN04487928_1281 [Butyrivibrio proteoclasticus]|uniref:Uncharacterized protein n=1 Tax=Butyrivibrio proteoclasticus TaxID=43305 RepID=A0A1I5X3T8_9FIRM|nr:hypothetical protein [Butyrivibrio proteoclasticus]SFQ26685.1 hypothetical protein SAMN04487928_1281 [Butyrivibrio proteoclasticus]